MNIYLFELDSVRNSEKEIEIGQKALFNEIVANGNSVILTYNQLSDSAAFWEGLKNEETYNAIMELCSLGLIRVSLFAGQRTAAQYILNHIKSCIKQFNNIKAAGIAGNPDGGNSNSRQAAGKNEIFYFSLVPLEETEGELLQDVYDAIRFSDVQLLKEKAAGAGGEKYLFLYRYAELILNLSRSETANHRQKKGPLKSMTDYLSRVEELGQSVSEDKLGIALKEGLAALKRVSEGSSPDELLRRSVWYRLLENEPDSRAAKAGEAIIDLCYNYALEDSISGVDKRYTDGDFEDFKRSFLHDLMLYMGSALSGEHVFHSDDEARKNGKRDFSAGVELPPWPAALRLVRRNVAYARRKGEKEAPPAPGRSRSERLAAQRKQWHRLSRRSLRYHLFAAAAYAVGFVAVNYIIDYLQGMATDPLESDIGLGGKFVVDFIAIAVFGILSSLVFNRFGLPDILETVTGVVDGIKENLMLVKFKKLYEAESAGNKDEIL